MTGTEALQQILETMNNLIGEMNDLKISVKLIENNIKVLNNRAGALMRSDVSVEQTKLQASLTQQQTLHQLGEATRVTLPAEAPKMLSYKKVFGTLINDSGEPINGVLIKVFNRDNEVCSTSETDVAGYWTSMLSQGKYMAEYTKHGFRTINKSFEVANKEVEVK